MSRSLRPERAHGFSAEFVSNGFNGTQAVISCGITENPASAGVIAHRLLNNVMVKQMVDEHLKKSKMSADEVIEELSSVAKQDCKVSEQSKMKALEMLAKAHNIIDKNNNQAQQTSREDQLNTAKKSYILAALPAIQSQFPNLDETQLKQAAEDKFQAWFDSLNLTPVLTDSVN